MAWGTCYAGFQTTFGVVRYWLFGFLGAGRLDDDAYPAGFGGGFGTCFGAAVDGIDFGFGVVGDDCAFGNVAAALDFGVAGQGNEVDGGGVGYVVGLSVNRAFVVVERLAEADWRAAGFHKLFAFVVAGDVDAAGADVERALFDDDVAGEGGALVVLVERALVGFNLYRLLAVALQGVGWGGGEKCG